LARYSTGRLGMSARGLMGSIFLRMGMRQTIWGISGEIFMGNGNGRAGRRNPDQR
jgi:hypothetical protein